MTGLARAVVFAFAVGWLGVGSFACAKAQAKTTAAGPPLEVPSPPPRIIIPAEEPVIATVPPPETPPAAAAAPPRAPARPAPPRRTEPERTETTPPPPAAATTGPPPPAEPPRELRPASPAADAAAERETREALARSAVALSRVDYGKLNTDARAQYDQSKRFMEQAQQALKDRNFVFAATLADKAAALAAELNSR